MSLFSYYGYPVRTQHGSIVFECLVNWSQSFLLSEMGDFYFFLVVFLLHNSQIIENGVTDSFPRHHPIVDIINTQ